jgi:hypothetical protein
MTLPDFLQYRDRDYRSAAEWMQRAYLLTHEQALTINDGYGDRPWDVEDAIAYAAVYWERWTPWVTDRAIKPPKVAK